MSWLKKLEKLKKVVTDEKTDRSTKKVKTVCIHGDPDCVRCAANDFDSQDSKVTRWETLDDIDLKRVVLRLPKNTREALRRNPNRSIVAGGFIRAVVGNEAIHDVDVFVPDAAGARSFVDDAGFTRIEKDLHYTAKEDDMEVQAIWRYPYQQAYEVLEQFDYTVAKVAVWFDESKNNEGWKSICHERFYRDLARKMLVYECDRDVERIQSFPRLIKYVSYGYQIEPKSLAEVIAKSCLSLDLEHGFAGLMKQLEDCYVAAGTDKEWTELSKKYVKPAPPPARSHDYSYGS